MSSNEESKESTTNNSTKVPEWLNENIFIEILKKNVKDFEKIKNFEAKSALETGENFMTMLLNIFIKVELKDGTSQNLAYMVKVPPTSEKMQEMLKTWRSFEKEFLLYTKYIPGFETLYQSNNKKINFGAKVFPAQENSEGKEIIIMEDLKVKGFRNAKRQLGLDLSHTKCALEKLAEFHAASACYYEKNGPYPEIYSQCLCSEEDLFADQRINTANLFIKNLSLYDANYLEEKLTTFASLLPDEFQRKNVVNEDEFNVLNHGDCWSNNIMFRYNSDGTLADTYFVDFQMSRYGSPAQDLSYLLFSSTSLENKIKSFDYFIAYYHEKLIENLNILKYSKQFPTLKDLHISLLRHSDWAYTIMTTVMAVVLLDPTDTANSDNIIDEGEKGDELRELMFTNSRYISHLKQLLPWFDNRGAFFYKA